MYPPNPPPPGQPPNPQQPQWQPSNPGWPGQPPNTQWGPPQSAPYGPGPMPPGQMQQPPGYPPQYPGQMRPPMMPQPPKKKMPLWQKILIGVAVGFVALCALVNGLNRAVQTPTTQPTATQAVQPTKAQATPTPTPVPEKVLFEVTNQTANLPIEKSKAFEASGTLKLNFGCQHDTKDGVDVILNVVRVEGDTFVDLVWQVRLNCFDFGDDTLKVEQGTYKVTASANGDTGWYMKITQ